jgi:hypothetical protein
LPPSSRGPATGVYLLGRTAVREVLPAPYVPDDGDGSDELATGSSTYGFTLRTPAATRLTVGRFTTRRHESLIGQPVVVGLDLGAESRGCNGYHGTMDVLGLTRDADGHLTSLAFDYESTCEGDGSTEPVRGSYRWGSSLPYTYTGSPGLTAPPTPKGRTARGDAVLTNAGTTRQTYGTTTYEQWHPYDTGQVLIEVDGCKDVTLAPGGSCRITVAMPSDGASWVQGHLITPDGTARGTAYSALLMQPTDGPNQVVLTGTPGRGYVVLHTSAQNTSYRVLRREDGGAEEVVETAVTMGWRDRDVLEGSSYTYRVVPQRSGVEGEPSNPVTVRPLPETDGWEGTFTTVDPVRILDTRSGLGVRAGKLGPGQVLTLRAGELLPDGVSAVALNLTGTEPTTSTFLAVAPTIAGRPATSNVNLAPGQTRPGQVVVPLAEDGTVQIYNNHGSTHVVVDLQGFYSQADGPEGGGYHSSGQWRALDTRQWEAEPLTSGEEIWVPIYNAGLRDDAIAVAVNLTVTEPTTAGHLIAWAGDGPAPVVSNANFAPGQTVANSTVVPVSFDEDGTPGIALRNSQGRTHVIVDVVGWYDDGLSWDDGLRFMPGEPTRILDTRTAGGKVVAGATRLVHGDDLPAAVAHVVNLTATEAGSAGWARAWSGLGTEDTSTLNFARGEDSPNLAVPKVNATGGFALTTGGDSDVHLVVDHLGYFY